MSLPPIYTLIVTRYDTDSSRREVLCTYHHKKIAKKSDYFEDVCAKLIGNDDFVQNMFFMLDDADSQSLIFYSRDNTMMYFAFTEPRFPHNVAQEMLAEMKSSFTARFNPIAIKNVAKNGLNQEAVTIFQRIAKTYCEKGVDRIKRAQADVDEVKGIMESNIEKVLDNTERLEVVADDAEELDDAAGQFESKSKDLKNKTLCQRYALLFAIIIIVAVVVIYVIIVVVPSGKKDTTKDSGTHIARFRSHSSFLS